MCASRHSAEELPPHPPFERANFRSFRRTNHFRHCTFFLLILLLCSAFELSILTEVKLLNFFGHLSAVVDGHLAALLVKMQIINKNNNKKGANDCGALLADKSVALFNAIPNSPFFMICAHMLLFIWRAQESTICAIRMLSMATAASNATLID